MLKLSPLYRHRTTLAQTRSVQPTALYRVLDALDVSYYEIAQRAGVNHATVLRLAHGKGRPTARVGVALIEALVELAAERCVPGFTPPALDSVFPAGLSPKKAAYNLPRPVTCPRLLSYDAASKPLQYDDPRTPLEAALIAKGLSFRRFALSIGLSPVEVTRYAIRERRPTLSKALRIAKALNEPVEKLFPPEE